MTTRVQDSPFRETAWDQRLDKMLDDLKTTVNPEEGRSSRRDNSLVSSFRSSSRSDSRNSNRGGVEDGGLMKHHHKEYTSPDKSTRVVSDQFEYESGDPNKHFHKKVMKSTYSNYKVSGDITRDLDALREGPPQSIMDAARDTSSYQTDNTKVVSASQKVANKLVDALSTIGPDGHPIPDGESGSSTDYSTLTRLRKNIKELDTMLEEMDKQESASVIVKSEKKTVVRNQKTTTTENIGGNVNEYDEREVVKSFNDKEGSTPKKIKTSDDSKDGSSNYNYSKTSNYGLANGKSGYDDDDAEIMNEPAGEVRKIVWRNRFEKTYEAQDGTPHISIEEEARRKREEKIQKALSSYQAPPPPQRGPVSPRNLQLQYAVYWPNFSPNISPGGQSWVDPIPMPSPPQISPKGEPGVAYVYTYGQNSSSHVQHLPPLNYVNMPHTHTATVPLNDGGAPSPTLSSSATQPVVYHYSYHYTLQPGHSLPDGAPQPPSCTYPIQPALQVAPTSSIPVGPPLGTYEFKRTTTSQTSTTNDRSDLTNILRKHHSPERSLSETRYPRSPRDGPYYDDRFPRDTEPGSNRNISITVNKHSSHSTHHNKDYPSGGPSTSTPFPTPGRRSRSSSPDKYPRGPGTTPYGTVTHISRTSYSDSLDRLKKAPHEGLPFPDTSPIRPKDDSKIPKRVDDLMTSLSDSEHYCLSSDDEQITRPHSPIPCSTEFKDGHRIHVDRRGMNGPRAPSVEKEPLMTTTKVSSENTELALSERKAELKKDESKNVAGPPVYYPPGHHQLFDESMHTMTLKENKRRGMAKWRMEKQSGYKEKSSSSESKGGMAMVPVCLPLCCGAACAIM